jgi:hypothetical protein
VNMIKLHYTHVWKCHDETYAPKSSKNEKEINQKRN